MSLSVLGGVLSPEAILGSSAPLGGNIGSHPHQTSVLQRLNTKTTLTLPTHTSVAITALI